MKNPFKPKEKRKKQLPPQKRSPEKYFKHMYLSEEGYNRVAAVAKLEKLSMKETLERMIYLETQRYFGRMFDENKKRNWINKFISKDTPKIPTSEAIKNLRKESKNKGLFSTYKLKKFGL